MAPTTQQSKNEEKLSTLKRGFVRRNVAPGKRLQHFLKKMEDLEDARLQAWDALQNGRIEAKKSLYFMQWLARRNRVIQDAEKIIQAYNGKIKTNPVDIHKETAADWDKAEKQHSKSWLALQDLEIMSLDVLHSLAKEHCGSDAGQIGSFSIANIIQKKKDHSQLEAKVQHFFKLFKNLEKNLQEPSAKLGEGLEEGLTLLDKARDCVLLELGQRQIANTRGSIGGSASEPVNKVEKEELGWIFKEKEKEPEDIEQEHLENLEELVFEHNYDRRIQEKMARVGLKSRNEELQRVDADMQSKRCCIFPFNKF